MKSLYLTEHDAFISYFVLPGSGPVHVYLPPLICPSTATLLQVATHPRFAGRASILVDYLGCGLSDRPRSFSHTMRDHARTVAAILDHEGVSGCVVVGHSMGGTVGLHLALDHPDLVVRLVLGESNVGPGGGDGTRHIASFALDVYLADAAPRELISLRGQALAGDATAAVMLAIREHGSDPRAVHAASCDIVGLDPNLLQALLDLPMPRAFIYGARTLDALAGRWTPDVPDRTALEDAGVATLVVPDAGHFMYFDNLDGYVAALEEAERMSTAGGDNTDASMKAMKLYDRVDRIHNELAALAIDDDAPLTVERLTPFDNYHYFGTDAVDEAIAALGLKPGMRVLDVGSGIGGPARYIAAKSGAHVTALELQPDLDELASGLTGRCGLTDLVEHRCGDILDGLGERYDAVVSFLCFLHIADRARLLAACRAALEPGGAMYIEDYAKRREASAEEAAQLEVKVQCPVLPEPHQYEAQLRAAGFDDVRIEDVSSQWTAFTAARLGDFRAARQRNVAVHGAEIVDGLDDFYATVAGLFDSGVIAGLKIVAR